MAGPITWQNITAPSFNDASAGLARAQQSLTSGFDSFNNVIKQRTEADNANWEQVKKNNTDAFMNKLLSTTSAEQFTALRDSGQLQQMLEANGAQIDQAAARSALDQRLGTLQTQGTASIKYNDAVRADKDAPLLAQARALSLAGDYTGAAQIGTQMSQQSQALLAADMDARKRDLVVRSQTDNKAAAELQHWKAQEQSWADQAQHNKGMLGVSQGQLSVAQQNARTQANEARLRGELAQAARLEKQLGFVDEQIGNADALATSNTGYKKITDWLATVKDPKKNELLTTALGKARADGALSGLSASQAIAALQSDIDTGNWFNWSDNTGDGLTKRLQQIRGNPASIEDAAAAENKSAQLKQMRADIIGRLYPGLVTSTPAAGSGALGAVNNPGAAAPGSAGTPSGAPVASSAAGSATEPANSPWTPALRQQEQADRARIARTGGDYSPAVLQALEKEAAMVRSAQDETSADKLKRVEAEIREKYKAPSGYETVYDRNNRTTNMKLELAQAKELVKSIDPQTASDRAALKGFLDSLREANGNAGAAIADMGMLIPRAALTTYDTAVLRPLRAAGMDLPNTAPLLTPNGVSTTSLTPFSDARLMRKALQDEAKKQR